MKHIKLFFTALACIFLTSCLEINEETEISQTGSGTLTSTMDLSQLIDMMQVMGGEEFEKKKDEKLDSIIPLASIIDTAKNLTPEQKALMRNGTMRVKMNLQEKVFSLSMKYPFNNLENLQQLASVTGSGQAGMSNLMKEAISGKKEITDQAAPSNENMPEMDQLFSIFDFNFSDGIIKKSVNPEKLKALLDNPKMSEMKQGAAMGIEVIYTNTYKLPRPVKKVDNNSAKISDDKKTVTIRQNLMEVFDTPEKFAYSIEY